MLFAIIALFMLLVGTWIVLGVLIAEAFRKTKEDDRCIRRAFDSIGEVRSAVAEVKAQKFDSGQRDAAIDSLASVSTDNCNRITALEMANREASRPGPAHPATYVSRRYPKGPNEL